MIANEFAENVKSGRCEDCPPVGYPTDKMRCLPCPRRATGAINARVQNTIMDLQPGDVIGCAWPSDEIRNFSADGRAMGRRSAVVFREALARVSQP